MYMDTFYDFDFFNHNDIVIFFFLLTVNLEIDYLQYQLHNNLPTFKDDHMCQIINTVVVDCCSRGWNRSYYTFQ